VVNMVAVDTAARIIGKSVTDDSVPVLRLDIDLCAPVDHAWIHGNGMILLDRCESTASSGLVRKLSRRRRVEAIRRICLRVMPASAATLKMDVLVIRGLPGPLHRNAAGTVQEPVAVRFV